MSWQWLPLGLYSPAHSLLNFLDIPFILYRELAIQAEEQFKALGAGMSLKEQVVIGGVDMQAQSRSLARRPHVVIATPGRLAVRERWL